MSFTFAYLLDVQLNLSALSSQLTIIIIIIIISVESNLYSGAEQSNKLYDKNYHLGKLNHKIYRIKRL